MRVTPVIVYGAGGQGCATAWTVQTSWDAQAARGYEVVCFVDDDEALHGREVYGLPVMSLASARMAFPEARVVASMGSPRARKATMQKAAAAGFGFETVIHPKAVLAPQVEAGLGTVVEPGCAIAPYVVLGKHVMVLLNCSIGHHVVIGDYSVLMSGSRVSGYVHLGEGVTVGAGAVIINGTADSPLVVGDYATIGAGACVTKPVAPGATVVGVPARPIKG